MESAIRRHPRVPTELPCTLRLGACDSAVLATAFSIASRGIGLEIDDTLFQALAVGSAVAVNLTLDTGSVVIAGSVAWSRRSSNGRCTVGIALTDTNDSAPTAFREWVDECFLSLREESYELVSNLASDGVVHWQALQTALDRQARLGGHLCDHLDGVEIDKLPSQH